MGYLIVFLGAGAGGALRHGLNILIPRFASADLPVHTFVINVVGSLLMGLIAGYFASKGSLPQEWRLFLTTGVLGGFTTFSAFALETAVLYERGELAWAAAYVLGSVIFAIGGFFLGLAVVRAALA